MFSLLFNFENVFTLLLNWSTIYNHFLQMGQAFLSKQEDQVVF